MPESYTVAATGVETKSDAKDGMCTWNIEAENVRDVGITVSDYMASIEENFEGVQVKCYYFNNDSAKEQAELMLETAVNSLRFYSEKIGGYPYETLDVMMTNDLIGAIEFPAYVRLGDYSAEMSGESAEYFESLIIENTAHEVAHQWFYAVVGNNGYREAWLDESFASFGALAYQLKDMSEKEAEETVALGREYSQNMELYLNQTYKELGSQYIAAVYEKGKYFLYDLMNAMGEENFYSALQEYYSTNAFKEVTTKDFTDIVYKYSNDEKVKELLEEYISK